MSDKDCRVIDKNFLQLVQLFNAVHGESEKIELFKKLLDQDEDFDINYKIPDSHNIFDTKWVVGQTIFQLVYTNTELCQILIDRGADYTVTDKKGSTVLQRGNCLNNGRYLRLSQTFSADNPYAEIILSAHVKSGNPKNPRDKNGVTHFHIACMCNHIDAVKYFLDNGICVDETVNSDFEFYPGYSALHFAVKFCAIETVELLLGFGANVFIKDSQGMNPVQVLIIEKRKTFIQLQKLSRRPSSNLNNLQYSNLQEYYDKNQKLIHLLFEKMKGCSNDAELYYFHFLCFVENTRVVKQFLDHHKQNLTQSISMDLPIWSGYTPLHFAAMSSVETMELLVEKGADLDVQDARGVTPLDICLKEFALVDLNRIFSLHPHYSNTVFSDGKTKLSSFFQAMQDTGCFECFLINHCLAHVNIFVPFSSAICAGHSPLHLAVICTEQPANWNFKVKDPLYVLLADSKTEESLNYLSRIDLCLKYNSNVTAQDATGSTPLHWAFRLQQSQAVYRLLDRHESSSNIVDEHGLSHLHIACAANNGTVLKKLLDAGANVNEVAASTYTWLPIDNARRVESQYVHNCFIHKGSTPLHFASTVKCPEIVQILVDHGADPLVQDFDGFNPLERLFKVPIFRDSNCPKPTRTSNFFQSEKDIIQILVRKIGDKLANTKPEQMLYCYSLLDDDLLAKILDCGDESASKILESFGITALHVACFTRNLQQVLQLVDKIDVNARVGLDSPLWPGCSPLHLLTHHRYREEWEVNPSTTAILDELLQRGADVAVENANGETPLHRAFKMGSIGHYYTRKMLEHLKDFGVNPISKMGYTHLHIASYCGDAITVKKLLVQGAKINQPSNYFSSYYCGYAAIHFAAAQQQKDVIDVLLMYGADCNKKNGYGGNSLHTAILEHRRPSVELLKTLISAGVDIYAKNMYGRTPFEVLLKSSNRTEEAIKIFLELGYPSNTMNPISGEGLLALALNKNQTSPIFENLVQASDIKDIVGNGLNAIHNVVSFERPGIFEFDEWEIIEDEFTPSHEYTRVIGLLMNLGLNIDHQNCSGLTPLHMAAQMQNVTGIVGLLENGADINIADAYGKPAFAYSLELARLRKESSSEPCELDIRILKAFLAHIYKLNLAGVGISTSNRVVEAKIREIFSLEIPRTKESESEVEKMRKEQINSQPVTFYELLSDTGVVTAFPYYLLRKKTAIAHVFNNELKSLREMFPEFAGILILQYRKALARDIMIDDAVNSLNFLLGFNMPAICLKIILRFLNNEELNTLIKSATNWIHYEYFCSVISIAPE